MKLPWSKPKHALSADQRDFWAENGCLILRNFFPLERVEAVNAVIERIQAKPETLGNATVDVLHGEHIGKRFRGTDAPKEAFGGPIKINDLFLQEPSVRQLALDKHLTEILTELLEGEPMICNSLNFLWGSQQPDHFDSWFMPPPVENKMAVSSICLEDVQPSAGPLVYYPGTHKIAPYRFSHGEIHAVKAEMPACEAYIAEQLKATNAQRIEFLGKAGDVFIWHGQLLHGGTGIRDLSQTRKTLVTHYWRASDVEQERAVKVHGSGYYLRREHQQTA